MQLLLAETRGTFAIMSNQVSPNWNTERGEKKNLNAEVIFHMFVSFEAHSAGEIYIRRCVL